MGVLIRFGGKFIDFDLDLLRGLCDLIDAHLDRLEAAANESPDPDAFGIFDRTEHVSGLGFAACQQYIGAIAALADVPKNLAIEHPPLHRNGQTVVALVNAAANHWKHSSEWSEPPGKRAVRTLELLDSLDLNVGQEYLMANVLCEIVSPARARFESLLPLLVRWRDEIVPPKK